MTSSQREEDARQFSDLNAPLGVIGSAKVRYAAAMYFHRRGWLSHAALEIYRALAKDDASDPSALLHTSGLSTAQPAVGALIAEIDLYLSRFQMSFIEEVRAGLAKWSRSYARALEPAVLPACKWLSGALASVQDRNLALAIERASPFLRWTSYSPYPRADIGAAFADGHAFASLIGEDGFLPADDFDLGLFLIAPGVFYPDHHHAAPELYAPLTGPHSWRFLPDEEFRSLEADVPVWNEPWAPHATLTGDVPFLCIFCWTKDVNFPAKIIAGREATKVMS